MIRTIEFDAERREREIRLRTVGSHSRYERACRSLAGGVSSGLRRHVRPYPLYFASGSGPRVTDVDGNTFIDYGLAWGPLILGHSPPELADAIAAQARRGFTFGAQHDLEFEVSERLTEIIPCADRVTFANSGTEAVQVALRLARAITQRHKFLKFEGHYHGWDDSVLVSFHPTSAQVASAAGGPVPVGTGQRPHYGTLVVEWNDRDAVEKAFQEHSDQISAVICEPMLCNSGSIPPEPGFLEFLREISVRHGTLLIFDEVITGFRLHLAGAQGYYGVVPDLATYAKALGGGIALSAITGRAEYMDRIADGTVVHAGTLNGNPIALACAKATLDVLSRPDLYTELTRRAERLRAALEKLLRNRGCSVVTSGAGAVFHVSFMESRARRYRDLLAADAALYSDFALALLSEGILVLPDGRWYLSAAHTDAVIDDTVVALTRILA